MSKCVIFCEKVRVFGNFDDFETEGNFGFGK